MFFFQVASSIVLCTFMSAPIMYVSARLVLISEASVSKYTQVIENTRRDVTAVALISVVCLTFSMYTLLVLIAVSTIIYIICRYIV